MNTDDKFHPINTIQRALDYGEPLDRDEVRELVAAFRDLEIQEASTRDLEAERDDALAEADELQAELERVREESDNVHDALNNLLKKSVGLSHA